MQWLRAIVDEVERRFPDGDVLIESGASPSGTYHFGHLREIITCDAILLELERRGRNARHVHFVDDLDGLRKIPANIPESYEQYLGKPLCDIPSPDSTASSYADYFLSGLEASAEALGIRMEIIRSHEKYRSGFFAPAIEKALEHSDTARNVLETISGHKLGEEWSPIQVNEDGYLKKRPFMSIDTNTKTLKYRGHDNQVHEISYAKGDVKLDWRIDWPARWWLLNVGVEPAGRDHSTRGGSFDTGLAILKDIFDTEGLLPVPYDFVNLAGDPKKMSASRGTGIDARDIVQLMPSEVARFFMLRYPPSKRLYFDPVDGVVQLMDEFAALAAKPDKTEDEAGLLYLCTHGQTQQTVSSVPFSHLVASYQSSLKDIDKTLEVVKRTEHVEVANKEADIIRNELKFIDVWLEKYAPEEIKFTLRESIDAADFSETERSFLQSLGRAIAEAPADADGEWFHQAIYGLKDASGLAPKELFAALYKALIGKTSGPRAGWFLSILPREWLLQRLRLEA